MCCSLRVITGLAWSAVTLFTGAAALPTSAQPAIPVIVEIEPNDVPGNLSSFSAPAVLSGSLPANDQDAFLWRISDAQAQQQWRLQLEGVPEALTGASLMRVQYGPDPNIQGDDAPEVITGYETLLTFGIRDGSRPVSRSNLYLPAGEYVVGIFGTGQSKGFRPPSGMVDGGGSAIAAGLESLAPSEPVAQAVTEIAQPYPYRLRIEPIPSPSIAGPRRKSSREDAVPLRIGSAYASLESGEGWYKFALDEKAAAARWTVSGESMIEHFAEIELSDAGGKSLATAQTDRNGHYRIPNLVLLAGDYYVRVRDKSSQPAPRSVRVVQSGVVTDASEQEPNDTWLLANEMNWDAPYTAAIDKQGEKDYYRFRVAESEQDEVFDISVDGEAFERLTLCLLSSSGVSRSCKTGKPPLTLDTLNLVAAEHGLLVERSLGEGPYTLTKKVTRSIEPNRELEPNNKAADGSVFGPKNLIKGTLPKGDTDFFTLRYTGEPQLWRIQAIGSDLHDLSYHPQHRGSRESVRATSRSRRVRLDNLFLLPGTHQFSLSSRADTQYVLRARPLGPPSPNVEREPNSSRRQAQQIPLDSHVNGIAAEPADADWYRFHVPSLQSVRLQLEPPPQTTFSMTLYWDGGVLKAYNKVNSERPLDDVFLLHPGDYYMNVGSGPASEIEYKLRVSRAKNRETDIEPNDSLLFARELPRSRRLTGTVGYSRAAADYYRLPVQSSPATLTVRGTKGEKVHFKLVDEASRQIAPFTEDEEGVFINTIPAEQPTLLYVYYGPGAYDLQVEIDGDQPPELPEGAPQVEANLAATNQATTVAAYHRAAQTLLVEATLENKGAEPLVLAASVEFDHNKWSGRVQPQIAVAPGESLKVPINVRIAPDIWPDEPYTMTLTLTDTAARKVTKSMTFSAGRLHAPREPSLFFELPAPLLGTINVAAKSLGAQMVTEKGKGLDSLIDGLNPLGYYFHTRRIDGFEPHPVIDLAGDTSVDVVGFSFHPFGLQDGQPAQRNANRVAAELSLDGVSFTRVLEVPLTAHTQQQSFLLDTPVPAKFAKLVLLDSLDNQLAALGEFKVFASKASVAGAVRHRNIAAPAVGGHVVWTSPSFPKAGHIRSIITDKVDGQYFRIRKKGVLGQWVIGFHNNRAALIENMRWRESPDIQDRRFTEVAVYASLTSPLGPWEAVGQWQLDEAPDKVLALEQPVWARFLKFVGTPPSEVTSSDAVYLPDFLQVFEVASEHSVISSWGQDSALGPYEYRYPPGFPTPPGRPANTSRAKSLPLGETATSGQVRLGKYDNWFRLNVGEGQNYIELTLEGYPAVEVVPELVDAGGQSVAWMGREAKAASAVYRAFVEPGDYWVKVYEPKRSVVFIWDTSGSTAGVRPIIWQSVMDYVNDLIPELDEAHMLPFGGDFLSQRWLSEPYMIQNVLNDYNGAGDSSAAETALVRASEKLRGRDGKRIIVIITDAATSMDGRLWTVLSEVRPRIISLGVSSRGAFSSNPPAEQDLLQNWAASGGGYYEYVENVGAVGRAFDRASTRIRQPAVYRVAALVGQREKPAPGSLEVVLDSAVAADVAVKAPAIEVILDASGSMLQRLEGKRRYLIAREVLRDLINNTLPDQVNFGLRAFGHKEPGSCRTDLELTVGPLDKAAALEKIDSITPRNLAKTPLADSLKAVSTDLLAHNGEKTVILITDGEETCDGDVPAALEALRSSGVDAVVNIVGFAIDDEALETQFRHWAQLGGGQYHAASGQSRLNAALTSAAALKFSVRAPDGEILGPFATGNEPISVPAGEYTVLFAQGEQRKARVNPGANTRVRVSFGSQ